jgi:3-oxoacyl-[acyl-carrier-protein] synthase-3
MVDTSDEWITQRTGIKERRVCSPTETASTLSVEASREALERANMSAEDVQMIVCATVTGDMMFPSTSCLIQQQLGAKNAGAFDLGGACAGFVYGAAVGASMIESGLIDNALVIGVDVLTKFVDWTDRSTCILFGDGAGAVVLKGEHHTDRGLIDTVLMADGTGSQHINMEVGGSLHPLCYPDSDQYRRTVFMAGAEVYRFAINAMGDACSRVLERTGLSSGDIDLFVPHQANLRIIEASARRLNLPDDKVFVNVHKYGNTSGGSVPLALYEAEKEGRLRKGMVVMTVGFGAGLVWGANVIRW